MATDHRHLTLGSDMKSAYACSSTQSQDRRYRIREGAHLHHITRWLFRRIAIAVLLLGDLALGSAALAASALPAHHGPFFLPSGKAAKIVTVTKGGQAQAAITVLTEAIAVKETGPKATVKTFGEVYGFSPTLIAVYRDQPTEIDFWNLQPDDEHDLALLGPDLNVLMYVDLLPLKKTSLIFTFHKEGEIDFKCLRHQPEMSGQILVLPPSGK
jgi:plastocyanin